jgi:hypothetical protein
MVFAQCSAPILDLADIVAKHIASEARGAGSRLSALRRKSQMRRRAHAKLGLLVPQRPGGCRRNGPAGEHLPGHFLTDRRQTPALVAVDPPYDTAISLGIRDSAEVIFLQLLAKLVLCPRLSYRRRNGRMLSASFSPPAGPCPISSIYTRTGNAAFTTRLITLLPKQFVRQERPSTIGRTRSKKSIRWACPNPKGRRRLRRAKRTLNCTLNR